MIKFYIKKNFISSKPLTFNFAIIIIFFGVISL